MERVQADRQQQFSRTMPDGTMAHSNPNPNPNPSPNPIPNQAGPEEERKLVEIDEIPPAWTGLDFSDLPDDDEPNGLKTDQASLGAVRTRLA